MAKLDYDMKERTVQGHRVKVSVGKNEVCGHVDGSQVYGVYVDDPARMRVSTSTAPSGDFAKSKAYVMCMMMVCETVEEITAVAESKD